MVASDVAARGLDIPSVTTVIHYDVARVVDTFIHRAGRTAVRLLVLLDLSLLHDDEDISWTRVSDLIWGSSQICRYFKKQSHYISICFFMLPDPSFPLFTNYMFFSSQRGVGEKAVGTSISLIAPAEEKEHQKICEAVRGIGSKSFFMPVQ